MARSADGFVFARPPAGVAVDFVRMDLICAIAAAGGFRVTFSGLKMNIKQRFG